MAKLYLFGIGGTGARVLRSLTMLMAAGVKIDGNGNNPITEIVPVIIDPDRQNGDLTRTVALMKAYAKLRSRLSVASENRFFRTGINEVLPNYTLCIKDTDDRKFKSFIDYSTMSRENKAMMEMLFSEKNLETKMDVGFKGNPNIGSVVLNQISYSDDFNAIMNSFQQGDRIFIISSVFGGTGASGFPLLLKTLRTNKDLPNNANVNNAVIGAVTVLPYFKLKTDNGSEIDSSTFVSKTKSAMAYYEKNMIGNGTLNALYYLADEQLNAYDNHEGMALQMNDAHLVEFLAATAIVNFCNTDIALTDGYNYELGIKDGQNAVTFGSFYGGLNDMLRDSLTQFSLTASIFNYEFDFISGSSLAANKRLKLDEDFYKGSFVRDLRRFLDLYRDWLNEMKGNSRQLDLFNFDSGKNKPFSIVTGVSEKKTFNPLVKKDYEAFYVELNSVAKDKCNGSEENKLLEMYYHATKKLVKSKFNF